MTDWQLKTPVCLLIFKRPDITERVFEVIRQAKPPKLLVVADGPHLERPGEIEKCSASRAIIERVDWDCEVLKNYAEVNMGCRQRVSSGLNWVFETVEEAIILEDDCLPHPTFFRFCEELLEYYRYDKQIMVISGNNFQLGRRHTEDSYYFSAFSHIWGWATWRHAWQHYDDRMKVWPEIRDGNWLKETLQDDYAVNYWSTFFQYAYEHQTAWDYAWVFACWIQNGLSILPNINLVSNIGFDIEATGDITYLHPIFVNLFANTPVEVMSFPLQHSKKLLQDTKADEFTQKVAFNLNWAELREQMANFWLSLSENKLKSEYLQANITRLLNSGIRDEPMIDTERNFVSELLEHVSRGFDDSKAIQYLLAAMLYTYPHQLPLQYDLSCIPKWLLDDYLKFMFDSPHLFQKIGEADGYYYYMQGWIDYVHTNIFKNRDSKLWQDVALFFTQNANFIPLYFNNENLRDIYAKRADIMEFALRSQDHQIDHEFPEHPPEQKKIRLGILAAHFGPQTETFATLPVYKHLNRDVFEIVLYTLKADDHRLERYCTGHADAFIHLPQDLASQVQTIRDSNLDILFVATNVTAVTNPVALLALHRLARTQVASVCSCVTTGMRNVDFYISGQLTEPEDDPQQLYTETLLTLEGPAHCYNFATEEQLLATTTVSRESLGIDKDNIVYISGANFHKITPEVEETWMKIIANVSNSRLVLYPFNPNWSSSYPTFTFKKRLASTCARYGLSEDRVIILEPVQNLSDAKGRLKLGDIYLDSYPFSGVTSLLDPLEAGLPVVLMDGNSLRSRMGPALLRDIQIPELIAGDEEAYIELAIALGKNPELRKQKSDQIKQRMQANPRFLDSRAYSAQMGALFQELFQNQQVAALKDNLKLRDINLIIFPDWNQLEDLLLQDLVSVVRAVVTHPERSQMTLLVDISEVSEEDVNLALSTVMMNLLMEEDLDVAGGPEISLVDRLSEVQWQALLPLIQARIVLERENQPAIAAVKLDSIKLWIVSDNQLVDASHSLHEVS